MFSRITRRIDALRSDERGALSFLQITALIVGPIILAVVGIAAISVWRLGGDLTGVFERDTQLTQMRDRMQQQVTNITEIEVEGDKKFTIGDQPSRRTAYYTPSPGAADVCVTNTWEFIPGTGGTLTLRNTMNTHDGDSCDSEIEKTSTWELTGFADDAGFTYENAYGRDLTFDDDGKEAGIESSANSRPDDLFDNEWAFPEPGIVSVDGNLNQVIGSTPAKATATTPMKQMRPGAVETNLGTLGAVVISRQHLEDDTYRNTFNAATELNDPRAKVEWSYRWAYNAGSTKTDKNAAWMSEWSDWSTLDYHDRAIYQGAKWQIQAKYRVVLGNEIAESDESQIMTWVRPVEKPGAPNTPTITLTSSTKARINLALYACPTETKTTSRINYSLDDESSANQGGWKGWTQYANNAAAVRNIGAPEGTLIKARGGAKCVGAFDESVWSDDSSTASQVQPVVTRPTETLNTVLSGSTATIKGGLNACPASTAYEIRFRYKASNAPGGWVWQSWTSWSRTSTSASYKIPTALREGDGALGGAQIRCVTDHADGPATTWTDNQVSPAPGGGSGGPSVVRSIASKPTISLTSKLNTAVLNATAKVSSCPAHLSYEGRFGARKNEEATPTWKAYGAWKSGANTSNIISTVNQGQRAAAYASVRCVSSFADGPAVQTNNSWLIAPITSYRPTITGTKTVLKSDHKPRVTATISGCGNYTGSTTGYEARVMRKTNTESSWAYGGYTAASAGSVTRDSTQTIQQGWRVAGGISARCISPYTKGPEAHATTSYVIRPVSAPAAPVVTMTSNTTNGSSTQWGFTVSAPSCATATNLGRQWRSAHNANSWGGWNTYSGTVTGSSKQGEQLKAQAQARCVGLYASSPWKASSSKTAVKPIVGKPSVTDAKLTLLSTHKPRVTAHVSSCPSGTTYEARVMRKTNAETAWSYGSFSPTSYNVTRDSSQVIYEGYRVAGGISARCVTAYAQGPSATDTTGYTIRSVTAPKAPVVTLTSNTTNGSSTQWGFTVNSPSCATGTVISRQRRTAHNTSGWGSWSTYSSTVTGSAKQGERVVAQAQARCHGKYDDSGWVLSAKKEAIKPIVGKPSVTSAKVTILSTNKPRVTAHVSSCPSGTTYQARIMSKVNGDSSWTYGSFGSTSYNVSRDSSKVLSQGNRYAGGINARCVSSYTQGPTASDTTGYVTKAITSKPSIGTVTNKIQSSTGWTNLHTTASFSGCPSGTTYQAHWGGMKNGASSWSWASWRGASSGSNGYNAATGIREGDRARSTVQARCVSSYTQGPIVSKDASNSWQVRGISDVVGLDSRNLILDFPSSLSYKARGQAWLGGDVCASHLTVQQQWRRGINDGGWNTETSWAKAPAQSKGQKLEYKSGMVVNQGAKAAMGISLRCVSSYAQGPATRFTAPTRVRSITSMPTMAASASNSGGAVYAHGSSFGGCPSGTTYQWYGREDYSSGWLGGSGAPRVGSVSAGTTAYVHFGVRCRSNYTTGPERGYDRSTAAPIPAPSTPGGVSTSGKHACFESGGVPGANVVVRFSGASWASYYQAYVSFRDVTGKTRSSAVYTVSNGSTVLASPYGGGTVTLHVRAVNGSGVSAWASASSLPGIGCGAGGLNPV